MPEERTYLEDEELNLRDLSSIYDFEVYSGKERIGTVADLFFDDVAWTVRFISVEGSDWLPDKKILVSTMDIAEADWEEQKFLTGLPKEKLQKFAALGRDEGVSRRFQEELYKRLKLTPYWAESEYETSREEVKSKKTHREEKDKKQDSHLFSARALLEYRLMTLTGDAGQIAGLIADDEDWVVYYLIVETGDIQNPRRVLVSTDWIDRIGPDEGLVYSDLTRPLVRSAPEYDPAAPVTRDTELDIYDYYGRPHYWVQRDVVEDSDDVGQGTQGE